jgi:hypothetical protein
MIRYVTLEYVKYVYKVCHKVFKKIQLIVNNIVNNYINYQFFKNHKSITVLIVRRKKSALRNVIFAKQSTASNVNKSI